MHFDRLSSAPVVQLIAAGALGLLVAPSVLARDDLGMPAQRSALAAQGPGWQELGWLTVAVLVVGWLAVLFPALGRALDRRLGGFSMPSTDGRADLPLLTRLALGAGYVVLIQAVLRRPLVLVLGPSFERFVVEATFGAVMLLVLFGLLVALHGTARPLIAGLAWLGLDTALTTSGTTPLAEPATWANGTTKKRVATTVAATGPTAATEPTLAATQAGPATPDGHQTMPTAEVRRADAQPTLAATDATAVTADGQQTVLA